MNAATAFEHRKDALRAQLEQAQDLPGAIRAVTMALEQVAAELMQDEQDEFARQRQQAVLAIARRAPQFLRAARAEGELRIAPKEEKRESIATRLGTPGLLGALVLAALAIAQLADGKALFAFLQAVGAGLLLLRGAKGTAASPLSSARAVGVQRVDAQELVRAAGELCAAADICVSDLALLGGEASMRMSGSLDEATVDLLVSLMEARATNRGDVALASLSQAEQRLRALGVEVVWYDPEHAQLFDLLPTVGEERTVRPALVRDGHTLRRGVAVCRMERSVGA